MSEHLRSLLSSLSCSKQKLIFEIEMEFVEEDEDGNRSGTNVCPAIYIAFKDFKGDETKRDTILTELSKLETVDFPSSYTQELYLNEHKRWTPDAGSALVGSMEDWEVGWEKKTKQTLKQFLKDKGDWKVQSRRAARMSSWDFGQIRLNLSRYRIHTEPPTVEVEGEAPEAQGD